jgi:hypothetical protein
MNNNTENQTELLETAYDYYWYDLYNNHEYLEQILINMNNQDDLEC